MGICNNIPIVNEQRRETMPNPNKVKSGTITYVMLRLDENVKDVDGAITAMLSATPEAEFYSSKSITSVDEDFTGGPVIYFP